MRNECVPIRRWLASGSISVALDARARLVRRAATLQSKQRATPSGPPFPRGEIGLNARSWHPGGAADPLG